MENSISFSYKWNRKHYRLPGGMGPTNVCQRKYGLSHEIHPRVISSIYSNVGLHVSGYEFPKPDRNF